MKTLIVLTCMLSMSAGALSPLSAADPDSATRKAKLMERKLAASQDILASLAREDFTRMSAAADELLGLAKQQWIDDESPQYRSQLKDFWIILEGVKESAAEKNLDGATLGYVQMTISCVRCHKFLRDKVE